MYIPLPLRLTLFYALVLGGALGAFGTLVYNQAEQRAYADLRDTLSSRAASVRLGKDILAPNAFPDNRPLILPDVNGAQSVAIEVLDNHLHLLAATSSQNSPLGTGLDTLKPSPVPWDAQAAQQALVRPASNQQYSTITYQNERYLVDTLLNDDMGNQHIIQTASSLAPIEQSLSDLRTLLLRGAVLVLALALVGGWFISWGVLNAVRRITSTARTISTARDFSKRIPMSRKKGRDELAILTATFNEMLSSLQEVYQRQQRFVADASHELRAPITAIRCNLDLLARAPDLPPEEVQAALTDARAEAERMGRLVNDLLLLAHADAQASSTIAYVYKKDRQKVDLDSLLLAVFRQYRPLEENVSGEADKRGPRLTLQHIAPAQVYGDRDQLTQALVALLDNALKYTPPEGHVALSLTVIASDAVVKVSDTGIGIAEEDLPHIFERFYRAQQAQTRKHSGSGLGLAIVQSIMREHNGTVGVESVQGTGSIFTLRLPLAERTSVAKS
jgi:two-component system, OmpR family, sensor kinase